MSKRRSSIRGKGAEILFGTPPAVETRPRSSELVIVEAKAVEPGPPLPEPLAPPLNAAAGIAPPPPPELDLLLADPDLEKALYEEARAGESGPEDGDEDLPLVELGLSETSEAEALFVEEASKALEPLESLDEEATVAAESPEPLAAKAAEAVEPVETFDEEATVAAEPAESLVDDADEAVEPLESLDEEATVAAEPPESLVDGADEAVEPLESLDEEAIVAAEPPESLVDDADEAVEPVEPIIEEAVAVDEPYEALEEMPTPAQEEVMDEPDLQETAALFELPPPETSDLTGSVLPPRPSEPAFDMADLDSEAADIQAPDEPVEQPELPDRELTEDEKGQLLARLEVARFRELDEQISRAYDQVLSEVGDNNQITTECHNLLLKARDIVLHRDASKVPQAEYFVEQVRARLRRSAESEAAAKKYAWRIAGWGLLWFAIDVIALFLLSLSGVQAMIATATSSNLVVNMEIFLPAMLWGGIGGVAAVFYSLFKHVGRRDFDSQYNLSYVGKPFLGAILGATVYMVVHLMILTLGILPGGLLAVEAGNSPIIMPWLIYLLAWACGFKENRIFDLVDRVIKQLFGGARTEPSVEPSA